MHSSQFSLVVMVTEWNWRHVQMQPHSNRLLIVVGVTIISWILRVSLAGLACLSNPCINGICIDDINSSFTCFCADGFTGELCGTNWDECWSSPCTNGGSCTDSIAAFNCSCPPGFTGERCEWNVDECASSPCLNGGSCIDQENGFVCSCPAGYAGHFCTIDVSVCNISYPMPHIPGPRCYNGGVCLDGPGPNFTCLCIAGWTGSRCEEQIDECASTPCRNGGLCIDLLDDYACACSFGYTGKNCEMTLEMCRGINGTRVNIFGIAAANDVEDEYNEDVCENGALCLLESNGAKVCYCVPDFHGDRCQYRYDECLLAESASWSASNESGVKTGGHCQNGGECIDGVDSFSCSCPENFTGNLCQCPLYIVPDSDVDPYCLSITSSVISHPSTTEQSSPIASSTFLSILTDTSFFTTEFPPTATDFVETTTMQEVISFSPELKVTVQEVFPSVLIDLTEPTQDFTSISTEETSPSIEITETVDFSTPIPTSQFSPLTMLTEASTKMSLVTSTDVSTSSTNLSPELSESSISTVSTFPGVVGEDKIWFSEEMTSLPEETISLSLKTEPAHQEKTTQSVEDMTVVDGQLDSTTEKPTDDFSDSFFTVSSQTESTKIEQIPHTSTSLLTFSLDTEATTSTLYEITGLVTRWSYLTTPSDQLSTIYTKVMAEDEGTTPAAETFFTDESEVTDSLITHIYTTEKTTAMPDEHSTEQIVTSYWPLATEMSEEEPSQITSIKPLSTQEDNLSKDFSSASHEYVDVTDEMISQPFYSDVMSEATLLTSEVATSSTTESYTPHITDIYPKPITDTPLPTSTTQTPSKDENTTILEMTVVSEIFTELTKPVLTEKEHTRPIQVDTTEISEISTVTMTDTSTATSTDTSSYAVLNTSLTTPFDITSTSGLFSEIETHDVTEVIDSQTDFASSTDETTETKSTTEIGCNVMPCYNGGTCYYNECECTFRFTGVFCEKKKHIEVASFNGHSYLLHSLNLTEFSHQEDNQDHSELKNSKTNIKRQSESSVFENGSLPSDETSDSPDSKEEYLDDFEAVYDYYEELIDSYNYSSYEVYDLDDSFEFRKEKDVIKGHSPTNNTTESSVDSTYTADHKSLINVYNSSIDLRNTTSNPEKDIISSMANFNSLSNTSNSAKQSEPLDESTNHSITTSNYSISSINEATTEPNSGIVTTWNKHLGQRGGRLINSQSISTSIAVKINLQERSMRVGGWGLVMKITLGNMAKASLTINHKTGLLRFHFTCGLGRSLLFGEEDGQRWAGLRRLPLKSTIIPVLVTLEAFPYKSVHKNNPSSGRGYLQCAASLKINGQVAVKGQQRAPMPNKSSSDRESAQYLLHLGGIPDMLLPCNHALDDAAANGDEKMTNYEQKDSDDEEEGFFGCMQDLKINGVERQIFEDALDGNGITECGESILPGKELERDDNPCFMLPCYGSATCEPTVNGSWRCKCPTGWLGVNCDQSVCDNNPCLYGATCLQDNIGGFVCLCPLGKGGRLCENDLQITKPCFDSGNDWDIEEHQPYIAYPLDHNHLSSPQLVFRFKFSPSSINQIGLLAYIGDLSLPKTLHSFQSSFLSELKNSYLENTTNPTLSDLLNSNKNPLILPNDPVTEPLADDQTLLQDVTSSSPTNSVQNSTPTLEDTSSDTVSDFLPPLDIPLFQDDAPLYLQNFTSVESFSPYSNYIFSPFAPYPYYLRQNGKDHMAVSYIRGHLVLTWDLGSGPRRIFTSKSLPSLYDDVYESDSLSIQSTNRNNSHPSTKTYENSSNSSKEGIFEKSLNTNSSSLFKSKNKDDMSLEYTLDSPNSLNTPKYSTSTESTTTNFLTEENSPKGIPISMLPEQLSDHNQTSSEIKQMNQKASTHTVTYSSSQTGSSKIKSNLSAHNENSTSETSKDVNAHTLEFVTEKFLSLTMENHLKEANDSSAHENSIPPPPNVSGMSSRSLPSTSPNKYHEVTIWREGQQAWLKVGNQVVRGQSPGRHYQLNAHRPFLYIGGHDASNVSFLPHDIPLHSSFSGCIFDADLHFGSGHSVLNKRVSMFTKGRGVAECGIDPCKNSLTDNPCHNGGRCIPRGPTFVCLCQKPWFGPLCADSGQNPCDEGIHSCKSGSTCVTLLLGGYKCDCLPGTYGLFCEKEAPIGWTVKLSGIRSFLGVRVPFRGWRKRPQSSLQSEKPKREAFCIDLEIKPIRPSSGGIILYVMGSHQFEFLSLSINQKGEPELRIGPGTSRMSSPLVIGYNGQFQRENILRENEETGTRIGNHDGRIQLPGWRKIRIFRRGQRVFLAMDGLLYGAGTLNAHSQNLPTIRPYNNSVGSSLPLLYLGGLPDLAMLPQDAVGDLTMARPFAGCIRNLAVDWQRVPLGEGSGSYGRNAYAC